MRILEQARTELESAFCTPTSLLDVATSVGYRTASLIDVTQILGHVWVKLGVYGSPDILTGLLGPLEVTTGCGNLLRLPLVVVTSEQRIVMYVCMYVCLDVRFELLCMFVCKTVFALYLPTILRIHTNIHKIDQKYV